MQAGRGGSVATAALFRDGAATVPCLCLLPATHNAFDAFATDGRTPLGRGLGRPPGQRASGHERHISLAGAPDHGRCKPASTLAGAWWYLFRFETIFFLFPEERIEEFLHRCVISEGSGRLHLARW
jgi:hypothetical protein